jgi:predicted DNA-binding transcriptional regulator AlpA
MPQATVITMTIELTSERELLTAEQVHAISGVPISTLHDWAAKRERGVEAPGPRHMRLGPRTRRWHVDDVRQWIASCRR